MKKTARTMASFRIYEDKENAFVSKRKENADEFSAAQRRALGDLSHFTCNQNRNTMLDGLTNGPRKVSDETRTVHQIKNEKNVGPPVAQFRAFSLYEDRPSEVEIKKREPTFKPIAAKGAKNTKKESFFINTVKNMRALCFGLLQNLKDYINIIISLMNPVLQFEKKDVEESPSDAGILSSKSISKNESEILEGTLADDEEDTTTAQTDREMFFHNAEYRQDIYEYMREIEVKHRAKPKYMGKQRHITYAIRSVLVNWIVDLCDESAQQSETLHLAVSYVDRFLSYMSVVRTKLQLLGIVATCIAAKYEEVHPLDFSGFVYTDGPYTKDDMVRMERLILKVLNFNLSTPTPLAFLSHYCISNQLPSKTFHLAAYMLELSLLEAESYLQHKPSVLAAAALATARHALQCRCCDTQLPSEDDDHINNECSMVAWPASLEAHSGYSVSVLEPCLRALARTHQHAHEQPHQAIVDKYRSEKHGNVSSIPARPLCRVSPYTPPVTAAAAAAKRDMCCVC